MANDTEVSTGQVILIVAFILMCAVVLVVGGIMGIVENQQNKKLPGATEFEEHLAEYAEAGTNAMAASSNPVADDRVGKVVPVDWSDSESPKVDFDILKALPTENRPLSDAEVQTIALTRYFEKEIPEFYDAGEPGYAYACEITLVDRATGALIANGEVAGTPPAAIMEGQHSAGALGDDVILDFILRRTDE